MKISKREIVDGSIGTILTGASVIIAALSAFLKHALEIHTLSRASFWTLLLIVFIAGSFFLYRAFSRKSRLIRPEALLVDPDNPTHLKGRSELTTALLEAIQNRIVFLEGESGAGKSALIRSGLLLAIQDDESDQNVLPLYFNFYGSDWESGPEDQLIDVVWNQLNDEQKAALGLGTLEEFRNQFWPNTNEDKGESKKNIGIFERIRNELGIVPLVIFDQFDDYLTQHRDRFLQGASWLNIKQLTKNKRTRNAFWIKIRAALEEDSLRCLFVARNDAMGAVSSVARFEEPKTLYVERIDPTYLTELMHDLIPADDSVIQHQHRGWNRLQTQLVRDLTSEGKILPIQARMVLKGLKSLPFLHSATYNRIGGTAGLEVGYIHDSIKKTRGTLPSETVFKMLTGMVDSSNPNQVKTRSRTISQLVVSTEADEQSLTKCLERLSQKTVGLVRKSVGDSSIKKEMQWSLYHDYLARSVLDAQRRAERWKQKLEERHKVFEDAGSSPEQWKSLLSPWEQVHLVVRHARSLSGYWGYIGKSFLFRFLPVLVFLATVLIIFRVWRADALANDLTIISETEKIDPTVDAHSIWDDFSLIDRGRLLTVFDTGEEETIESRNLAIGIVNLGILDPNNSETQTKITETLRHHALAPSTSWSDFSTIAETLSTQDPNASEFMWDFARDSSQDQKRRLRAYCFVALQNAQSPHWTVEPNQQFVARQGVEVVSTFPRDFKNLSDTLNNIGPHLAKALTSIALDHEDFSLRQSAGRLLIQLCDLSECNDYFLFMKRDIHEIRFLLQAAERRFGRETILNELFSRPSPKEPDHKVNQMIVGLLLDRRRGLTELLQFTPSSIPADVELNPLAVQNGDPTIRVTLIRRIGQVLTPLEILDLLEDAKDPVSRSALILALGQFGELPDVVTEKISSEPTSDIPELQMAMEWILQGNRRSQAFAPVTENRRLRGKLAERVRESGYTPRPKDEEEFRTTLAFLSTPEPKHGMSRTRDSRGWYTTKTGVTMIKVTGGTGLFGRPKREPHHWSEELFQTEIIKDFELSATEVTITQYTNYLRDTGQIHPTSQRLKYRIKPDGKSRSREFDLHVMCPAQQLTYYEAARFCNWLSSQEGFDPCYEPNSKGEFASGMKFVKGRTGFRLPTTREWEYACRAGSKMRWSCGDDRSAITTYARFFNNSSESSWPVGSRAPNWFGFFDMHGNVWEWCSEPFEKVEESFHRKGVSDEFVIDDKDYFAIRGGCLYMRNGLVRCGVRLHHVPTEIFKNFIGFRVARSSNPLD